MLKQLQEDRVSRGCDACDASSEVLLECLTLKPGDEALVMPPCTCGAVEVLLLTPEPRSDHGALVAQLFQKLGALSSTT
jgi:hypothetical protein